MVQLNFDARSVAPDTGFEVVPAGWYNVAIDESEMKPTKDGAGAYLQLRFNILDGQYHGRKLFARLNLRNASAVAQEIAYKQLSAIAHAVGVLNVGSSEQLHALPLKVRVKVRKADGDYDEGNDITSYKSINDAAPGAPAAAGPAVPAAPAGFGAPAAPAAPAAPVPAFAPPAAPAPATPAPAAPPAAEYQLSPDGTHRWKPGMTAWEPVPVQPALNLAPPAPAVPTDQSVANQPVAGWQPPTAAQPWTPPAGPAAPTAPPAVPAAAAPAPAQAASPPWAKQ